MPFAVFWKINDVGFHAGRARMGVRKPVIDKFIYFQTRFREPLNGLVSN